MTRLMPAHAFDSAYSRRGIELPEIAGDDAPLSEAQIYNELARIAADAEQAVSELLDRARGESAARREAVRARLRHGADVDSFCYQADQADQAEESK